MTILSFPADLNFLESSSGLLLIMADLNDVCKTAFSKMDQRNVFWFNSFSRMHCHVWLVRSTHVFFCSIIGLKEINNAVKRLQIKLYDNNNLFMVLVKFVLFLNHR